MCFDASECLTKVVLCFPFFRNVKICFAKAIVNFDFCTSGLDNGIIKVYGKRTKAIIHIRHTEVIGIHVFDGCAKIVIDFYIFTNVLLILVVAVTVILKRNGRAVSALFLKIKESPMLPSNAAPKTVHGVRAVIPSQSSYMIHINAMENRISQKFTLRIPLKRAR